MRIIRYKSGETWSWGTLTDEDDVIAHSGFPLVSKERGDRVGPLAEMELLAPAVPSKVVCVGRNYHEHAKEFGNPVPDEPLLFTKPPSSIVGPGADVEYPALSKRVDPEAELCLVIGRTAHRVGAPEAWDYIGGYTCGNDVTARDIQKGDGQWTRGKGFHTFCPLGPWIETEYDPSAVRIVCSVNREIRQDGTTKDFIFDIPYLIEYISRFTRLEVGDVIMTGTPEGVRPVEIGDEITVEVEGIGTLTNSIVAER